MRISGSGTIRWSLNRAQHVLASCKGAEQAQSRNAHHCAARAHLAAVVHLMQDTGNTHK